MSIRDDSIAERALRVILSMAHGSCGRYTSGIGSCYRNRNFELAHEGAYRVCEPCIAHRALLRSGAPLTLLECNEADPAEVAS